MNDLKSSSLLVNDHTIDQIFSKELCYQDDNVELFPSSLSTECKNETSNYQFENNSRQHQSSSSFASSTSSESSSYKADSTFKSDFHIVGGKIGPTLKSIRYTLNLGIDPSKRYDRLSSKSSINNSNHKKISIDESDVQLVINPIFSTNNKKSLPSDDASSMKLSNIKGFSVTSALYHNSSNNSESKFSSNAATMLLPNTNTFRSFIKTKSTGIMSRKDNNDEDDEEAEKLCDSEGSKILSDCSTPTNPNINENLFLSSFNSSSSVQKENLVTLNVTDEPFNMDHSNNSYYYNATPNYDLSHESGEHSNHYNNHLYKIDENNAQISNSLNTNNDMQKNVAKRHSRTNLILPILKSNRFVKQTKGGNHQIFKSQQQQQQHNKENKIKKKMSLENVSPNTSQDIVMSLRSDRLVMTQPDEDRRRRTIIIEKKNNSFGFTLQTYGIKHCQEGEVELITYVDEVVYDGPAFRGGMRPGDVILSINGRDVEKADHRTLVTLINSCERTMRLVVLFEDCVRKIELHLKFIKLKRALQQKLTQFEILNQRENQMLLNAALRSHSQLKCKENNLKLNDGDNNENNENFDVGSSINGQLKKYKCKSLDVSLNDIVDNNGNNTHNEEKILNIECDCPEKEFCNKKHSTSLPRRSRAYSKGKTPSGEEIEILIDNKTIDDEEEKSNIRQKEPRSKSLPQSVANSLDCLTNEAYEDDENLIEVNDHLNQRNGHESSYGQTSNAYCSNQYKTSDKDIITKL